MTRPESTSGFLSLIVTTLSPSPTLCPLLGVTLCSPDPANHHPSPPIPRHVSWRNLTIRLAVKIVKPWAGFALLWSTFGLCILYWCPLYFKVGQNTNHQVWDCYLDMEFGLDNLSKYTLSVSCESRRHKIAPHPLLSGMRDMCVVCPVTPYVIFMSQTLSLSHYVYAQLSSWTHTNNIKPFSTPNKCWEKAQNKSWHQFIVKP